AALRQAAESLDYERYPAKILLVSDGIENCGQDPCHAAAELAANAKDLSIDVIGFDMKNHQMGQLECIATNGNGHIIRSAVEDFSETMDQTMTAAIEGKIPEATLSLSTTLLGQTLTQSLRYQIRHSGEDDALTMIAESFLATPSLKLPAGEFVVEAIYDGGEWELINSAEIRLSEGEEVQHVFNLDDSQPSDRQDPN
ncbi:MAG: hypothetical protein ACR2RE_09620, partial [Geminicoccaceae bacterium]